MCQCDLLLSFIIEAECQIGELSHEPHRHILKKIHQLNPQTYKVMSLETKIKPQTAINCNLHSERKQVAQKIVFDLCATLAE